MFNLKFEKSNFHSFEVVGRDSLRDSLQFQDTI